MPANTTNSKKILYILLGVVVVALLTFAIFQLTRPAAPFPKIFGRIDKLMKAYFQDQPTTEVTPALPAG